MKESKKFGSSNTGKAISVRVLLVDDETAIQKVVAKFLSRKGFVVTLAGDGREALAAFIEETFDIVLTDFNMPVMDGLSLAARIKKRSPDTPIILMTANEREYVLKEIKGWVFYSVMFKPFTMQDLQSNIHGALACT